MFYAYIYCMAKKIILNADDFGPCDALNQGIYTAIDAGLVSSVSAFVTFGEENYNNIVQLKKYLDDKDLNVGIGLHFTLNAGKPVNQDSNRTLSFEESGMFAEIPDFKWRVNLEEFKNEMKAQIDKLGELIGGVDNIDHINSHVGICQMRKEFWDIMTDFDLPVRSPDKFVHYHHNTGDSFSPLEREAARRFFTKETLQNNFLQKLKYMLAFNMNKSERNDRFNQAVEKSIKIPNLTFYEYYKQGGTEILKNVVDQLAASNNPDKVIEIVLHLSINDKPHDIDNYNGIFPISFEGRSDELKYLLESDLVDYMAEYNIELTNYSNL